MRNKKAVFKSADSSELISLLMLDAGYEGRPLGFRMQPNFTIFIPFKEYLKFCGEVSFFGCLASDNDTRNEAIARFKKNYDLEGARGIVSLYSFDMAFGIFKELYYTGLYSTKPTRIMPTIESIGQSMYCDLRNVQSLVDTLTPNIKETLLKTRDDKMLERGYKCEAINNVADTYEHSLALYLLFLSEAEVVWHYSPK